MTAKLKSSDKARRRVKNVYHMLLYAWRGKDGYLSNNPRLVGSDKSPTTIPDLFAEILIECITRQLKRGLSKSYQTSESKISGVKGRIHVSPTFGGGIYRVGQTVCSFDEFTEDISLNRIVKSTLGRIYRSNSISTPTRKRIKGILGRLDTVTDIQLNRTAFSDIKFDKNTSSYRLPIKVCEFIYNDAFPTEEGESMVFKSLSEETLGSPLKGKLFQDFVTGFMRTRMPLWKVPKPPRYARDHLMPANGTSLDSLENLELDVLGISPGGVTWVIECKFYNSPFSSKFGGSAKVPNSHLLQLEAYIDLIIADPNHGRGSSNAVCGLLLYVTPEGSAINADFSSKRYNPNVPLKIRCIDLTKDWSSIEANLVKILDGASG